MLIDILPIWLRGTYFAPEGDGGGGGGTGDGGAGDPPKPPEPPKPPASKMLTQEEVNAIAAREKEQGARAAEQRIADELGVPLEDAKSILAAHRKAEDEKKSQEERLAAKDAELTTKEKELATREHGIAVTSHLVLAGVTDSVKQTRIRTILEAEGRVKEGSKPDDISAAIAKLREESPELFGTGTPPPPPSGPRGNPPPPRQGDDAFQRGMERAKSAVKPSTYAFLEKK